MIYCIMVANDIVKGVIAGICIILERGISTTEAAYSELKEGIQDVLKREFK